VLEYFKAFNIFKLTATIALKLMMYKILMFTGFVFFISSCDQPSSVNKEVPIETSSPESRTLTVEEAFTNDLLAWKMHWSGYIDDFSINKFIKGEEAELQDLSSDLIPELTPGQFFQENIIISPDGSRYLELYSYKIIISQKEGNLIGAINPDTEAVVIDPGKETRNRVLFMGPAGGIEDAVWLSNNEIIISGFGEIESGYISPMFWHIDLNNRTIISYEYPAAIRYEQKAYLQKIFPYIKFD
jgi:hypothetical protein